MAKGFYSTQDGHFVNLLPPVDITGGKTSPAFAVKLYAHISILIQIGVSAAAFTKIILNACSDNTGANPIPQPYNLYACETANGDVLSGRTAVPATGYSPSANDGIFYVIEIDAAALPQGSPYLQLQLTNTTNSVIASAAAILSGSRYAHDQSETVLT